MIKIKGVTYDLDLNGVDIFYGCDGTALMGKQMESRVDSDAVRIFASTLYGALDILGEVDW